jgi:cytoskeletal protein CcmA (bactofilin family)
MNQQNLALMETRDDRRFLERTSDPTLIGAGTVLVGDVRGHGQFVVAGEIHGDGALTGELNLSESGSWNGRIQAGAAVVAGRITGSLEVAGKLEIGRTAVIRGKVSARTLAIAKGAIIDGEIEVTSGKPVLHFEDRRSPQP